MIYEERLLRVLRAPLVSEKASIVAEQSNTVVFKVAKDANKHEVKQAVQKLFKVEVNCVRTLIVKGKVKRRNSHRYHCGDWKKAYVTLKAGQKIDFATGAQ